MPRDNRCMYMVHVCFMYVVGVCGNVCCVEAVVKDSGFLSLGVLKYVVCLYKGCDGCCVFYFVMQMLYVCVLVYILWQFSMLHWWWYVCSVYVE